MLEPLFIDVGWLGSPVDVATLIFVLALFVYEIQPNQSIIAAVLVALARGTDRVDDELVQGDLEVEDREVDRYTTDGGRDRGGDGV